MTTYTELGVGRRLHGRIRVLLIDDDLDHRVLMERKLRSAGYVVDATDAAEPGLERIDAADLVLVDYRLPSMDGLEFIRVASERGATASIILMTSEARTEVAVEALQRGAVDFIAKAPGFVDQLPQVVERARRHHEHAHRARELQRQALLVDTAHDRASLFDEIVAGVTRLFRATSTVLLLDDGAGLEPVAAAGRVLVDVDIEAIAADLPPPGAVAVARDGSLLAALLADEHEPAAFLILEPEVGDAFLDDEVELAATYAAFAGIALRNLRRRELETALIDQLQATMQARQDFVASVSHELRTPLTSILGFAELLRSHEELPSSQRRDFLDRIVAHATELEDLVAQLIDLASLQRGRALPYHVREASLVEEVENALASLEGVLRGRLVAVEVPDVRVVVDPDLLRRVLGNLLSNAVKFSEPHAHVAVVARADGDHVRIEVHDRGIGLEPAEAARVFDAFWRAPHSVANAVRGSGIGLALTREYVRALQGQIGVDSQPGEGSNFWFTVPLLLDAESGPAVGHG